MVGVSAPRLAVIAGQGDLPLRLARTIRSQGREVTIFTIAGQADADFSEFNVIDIVLGTIGETREQIKAAACAEVVMVGKVRRPSLAQLRPDAHAVKLLARSVGKGDDALLRVIASFFEEDGISIVPVDRLMPEHVMPEGIFAGKIDETAKADIDCGQAVLDRLGDSDIGQAIVVQNQRILAIEAAEGTDEMLTRCRELIDMTAPPAILLKCAKLAQDRRLDLPVIGADTLQRAAAAGVRVIACEAGGVLLSESSDILWQEADRLGLSVIGV
ncbi:MAG: UDP-2,3-diacylglucosamine pyrophosphatase [Rhodospirillaceae bacterium]|nr:UDP-2,3-diacylglucosamine pyrophosphatase [Rhodospirillaceae bacterium]